MFSGGTSKHGAEMNQNHSSMSRLPDTLNSELTLLNEQLGTNSEWVQNEFLRTQKLQNEKQERKKQENIKRTVRHFKELHKSISDLRKREKATAS